jgi:Tfp pilus assembly protein PilF
MAVELFFMFKRVRSAHIGILCLIVVSACIGCAREGKTLSSIKKKFANGSYKEVVILSKRALENDSKSAEVRYYYGLSLLALERDHEAFSQLEKAVFIDSLLAPGAARILFKQGEADLVQGRRQRASGRLMEAARLNASLPLGSLTYIVADAYYRNKDYSRAVIYYERAIANKPDTTAAEEAYMQMAEAYAHLQQAQRAEDSYRCLLKKFPRGSLAVKAKWRLANLLLEEARSALDLGNYDRVLSLVHELLDITRNASLIQNARFVLGEAYEGLSEYDMALEQYKEIIRSDQGASGSIIERARQKIEAYRRAGLYK